MPWKRVAAVDFLGERRDFVIAEAAHGVAKQVGGIAKPEIEGGI
jgi:hypothetical protein